MAMAKTAVKTQASSIHATKIKLRLLPSTGLTENSQFSFLNSPSLKRSQKNHANACAELRGMNAALSSLASSRPVGHRPLSSTTE